MEKRVICCMVSTLLVLSVLTFASDIRLATARDVFQEFLSNPATVVYVSPPTVTANPESYFVINVSVADVVDLYVWQFTLKWPYGLLGVDAENITEGSFLEQSGPTVFAKKASANYINVGCTLLGAPAGVNGSGLLATVIFKVLDTGSSNLEFSVCTLYDSTLTEISHTSQDGYFYTTWPVAAFSYSPTEPHTNETVTFDASASYDMDGEIVRYTWDFGDGTTGLGLATTHSYTMEGRYTVTLQVTDNDGFSDEARTDVFAYAPLLAYISVPYHRQITNYYCGPASLQMLFDFYGPDIAQQEIAEVARTAPDGTYTGEMIRAAHFSNLSTSAGGLPQHITGYSSRSLGYAALECWDMTIDQLKSLIDAGYPIIVLTTWHYRVAVGYTRTRITFQDSYHGENTSLTYQEFDRDWDYSGHWALLVCPWQIEVIVPCSISLGNVFNVTASITYPLYPPFPSWEYPAFSSTATIALPAGLSLIPNETPSKTANSGDLAPGHSANITWAVQADIIGTYMISVEAEGSVAGSVGPLPSFPEPYDYEDRIGGFNQIAVEITTPQNPVENTQELTETIDTWNLHRGTKRSLLAKLEGALHFLSLSRESCALHILEIFLKKIRFLQGEKLTAEQADYLISKTQGIIDSIQSAFTSTEFRRQRWYI